MNDKNFIPLIRGIFMVTAGLAIVAILLFSTSCYFYCDPSLSLLQPREVAQPLQQSAVSDLVEDGIHVSTGLIANEGMMLVVQNCTSCHSAKMITQNRATKEGWKSMIKWMQQTQNLWDLGVNEEKIVTYLAANYAPQKKGRRARLSNIEWYELE
jgi:hypothetical protein